MGQGKTRKQQNADEQYSSKNNNNIIAHIINETVQFNYFRDTMHYIKI